MKLMHKILAFIFAALIASATHSAPVSIASGMQIDGSTLTLGAGNVISTAGLLPGVRGGALFKPYGSIYSASSFSSLTGFTNNGATVSASGGTLNFSGGAGTYTQSLDYNYYTTLPQWSCTVTVIVGTINASSNGIGCGIRSAQVGGAYYNAVGRVEMSNSNTGTAYISVNSGTLVKTSTSALSLTAGDTVSITMSRSYDTLTVSAYDVTTASAPVTATYQFQFGYSQSALTPNEGKFAIFSFGGNQSVSSFSISSLTPLGADVALVGDSKTVGYYASSYATSYPILLQSQMRVVNLSGGSDQTGDVLNEVAEIIALAPKSVILNIGRNDVCGSVSLGVTETHYASIVSQLQAAGITVYHLLPLYEPGSCGSAQAGLTSWINATYPASAIISAPLASYAGTSTNVLAPDNVHPNDLGNQLIANAISNFYQNLSNAFVYQNYIAPVVIGGGFFPFTSFPPTTNGLTAGTVLGTYPEVAWGDSAGGADGKLTRAYEYAGHFILQFLNDASNAGNTFLDCSRNVYTPTGCSFGGGALISEAGTQSNGTKFTTSGCSVSSTTGGATAGAFTAGANNCSVTITMNGATGLTAANGWACTANDETTAGIVVQETGSNTTTATLKIPLIAGSTDVVDFHCTGF